MPSQPNRLQPDTSLANNLALINDNADKSVADISDLGAKFSDVFFTSITVAAGTWYRILVSLADDRSQYRQGLLPFSPRVDIWVDTDNTDNSLLHNPTSTLTAEQLNCLVTVRVVRTTYVVVPTNIGTFEIIIKNFGASSHTYYIRGDAWFMQSPISGNYR